ncbi:MAG: DUF2270 domain-containing protein [Anaerolineales bacterium]
MPPCWCRRSIPHRSGQRVLAESLLSPSFPISLWEAMGRRLRRNYLWIFLILYAAWVAKIWLFPVPPADMTEFIGRAAVGPVDGNIMIGLGFAFYFSLFLLAVATFTMTRATGEVLPRFGEEASTATSAEERPRGLRGMFAPRHQRKQLLAIIITEQPDPVSKRILADVHRGVTAMTGKGMYSGTDRSVLMCALTVTEVHNLKSAVAKEDPNAFVIVSPAQEILGRGFNPLAEK